MLILGSKVFNAEKLCILLLICLIELGLILFTIVGKEYLMFKQTSYHIADTTSDLILFFNFQENQETVTFIS